MTGLAFVLLALVAFGWLFVRSVRAGYGKLLFWLVYTIGGLCAFLVLTPRHTWFEQAMVTAWAVSIFALPCWWFVVHLMGGPAEPRAPGGW